MTIFNVRYTPNGINIYNYDYDYDHIKFYFYICFDALLFGLFLGLSNIVLPLIYN